MRGRRGSGREERGRGRGQQSKTASRQTWSLAVSRLVKVEVGSQIVGDATPAPTSTSTARRFHWSRSRSPVAASSHHQGDHWHRQLQIRAPLLRNIGQYSGSMTVQQVEDPHRQSWRRV